MDKTPKEHCQNGRADVCLAGAISGICCPENECDIDSEARYAKVDEVTERRIKKEVADNGVVDDRASNSELLPCPKCRCDDLETSPFETTRHGDWEIRCGHPNCDMYLQSKDKKLLCIAWNLIPRQPPSTARGEQS